MRQSECQAEAAMRAARAGLDADECTKNLARL